MSKIYRLIVLLLVILLPVNVFAKVVSSVEYNGYVYDIGYVCDFQVDSISYIIRENGVYVSAEMYLVDSVGYSTLSTVPWEVVINNSYQGTVTIPETVNYGDTIYDVIGIADAAFKGCINLNQIVFPISVTHIGNAAFYGCSNLKEVTLPPSLSVLGLDVFRNCTGLESVSFPDNLKVIGVGAFRECSKLRYLIIPDSVGKIDYLSFYGCSGLKKLYIPANVSEINITAFANCFWIDSIIWDSPLVLPDVVVSTCKESLSYFRFGNEIRSISQYAFGGCINLTSITIPEKVIYLGEFSFQNCSNLKKIEFEGSPTIYSYAFLGCSNIDSIIFKSQTPPVAVIDLITTDGESEIFFTDATYKNAVLSIPEGAYDEYAASDIWSRFRSLYRKTTVDYNGHSYLGYEYDFQVDNIFYTIHKNGVYVSAEKYLYELENDTSLSVTSEIVINSSYQGGIIIPETVMYGDTVYNVTGIEDAAFKGCIDLEGIMIPSSVSHIGKYAFLGCIRLKGAELPESLSFLDQGLFKGCLGLKYVVIPKGVTWLGNEVFSGCEGLEGLYIVSSRPIKVIDEMDTFYGVSRNLCTIYVPNNGIEKYKRTEVWKSFSNIEENPMLFTDLLSPSIHYQLCNEKAKIVDADCSGDIKIPSVVEINGKEYSVSDIGNYAFANNTNLKTVVFPEGVTAIGRCAFRGCVSITSISLPSSIKEIGDAAFYDCVMLSSVTNFNDNPCSINVGDGVFGYPSRCDLLVPDYSLNDYSKIAPWCDFKQVLADLITRDSLSFKILSEEKKTVILTGHMNQSIITIPSVVTYNEKEYTVASIQDNVFNENKNLISITIPSSVETIGKAAFYGCSNLKAVMLPNNLSVIDEDVFRGCTSLSSISFPENIRIIGARSFQDCCEIKSLIFPDSLQRIEGNAFDGCSGVRVLSMPARVSYMDFTAFQQCSNIDSIYWNTPYVSPSPITRRRYNLKYVSLGDEIEDIEDYSFDGCVNLTSITIPEKVKRLGTYSFADCWELRKIVIDGSPIISEHSFRFCHNIDTIVLKSSIPPMAINYLKLSGIDDGVADEFFGETTFQNAILCIPEGSYDDYVASDLWSKFISLYLYKPGGYEADFESDTIYYTIEKDGAFVSAKYIDINDFGKIYGYDGPLTPRDPIAGGQQPRTGRRSVLKRTSADSLGYNHYRGTVVIPESVTYNDTTYTVTGINYYTFIGCKELESVFIPESVKQLGYGSFVCCEGLKSVNIPSGVTMIPDAMFYGCTSLDGLEIPSGVDTIGHSAFYECTGLIEVTIPESVELIDEYAFAYCSGLKRVIIEGNPEIAETAFIGCGTELEVVMTRVEKIKSTDTDFDAEGAVHYGVDGRKIPADAPGLHIIKYKNGAVGKVWVR